GGTRRISQTNTNVWESAWLGPTTIVAIVSHGNSGEDAWYAAKVVSIDTETGQERVLYEPGAQLGSVVGSPSGHLIAFIEAVCSDRGIVAGLLRLTDDAGVPRVVATSDTDVTALQWINDERIGFCGVRGLEIVVGWVDVADGRVTELLSTRESS